MKNYPTFTLGATITEEQLAFFNQHGFIHFKKFIHQEAIDTLVNASKKVEHEWVSKNRIKANGVPIKYGKDLDGSTIVQRFAFINQHNPVFSEVLFDPRFEALTQIVPGSRIGDQEKDGMVLNHYINGPESKFTQMGWHTDGLRDLFYGTLPLPMLNVGIHLSTLKPENGGLRILPGTHKQGLFKTIFRKKYFLDTRPDKNEIAIVPEAGDLTVHDGRLWHRVAKSTIAGEESRRRVIYVPIITGKVEVKTESSPTLFYQKLNGLVK